MLPYLQSYNDPKIQKAYERSLAGESLRHIAKALRISLRTLARRSKEDGWIEERKARTLATESPNVATAATAVQTGVATADESPVESETRVVGMERMLRSQQRIAGMLRSAYQRDLESTLSAAETAGKPPTRAQIAQLVILGNNVLAMERKAWCVPDKIETKDTTPTPADRARSLTDEQLERELADAQRAEVAAASRETPAPSVN